jgi:hypothetical protein
VPQEQIAPPSKIRRSSLSIIQKWPRFWIQMKTFVAVPEA